MSSRAKDNQLDWVPRFVLARTKHAAPACPGFLCLKTFAQKPLRQNQPSLAKARFELIKHEIQLIARAELSRRIKGRSLPPN